MSLQETPVIPVQRSVPSTISDVREFLDPTVKKEAGKFASKSVAANASAVAANAMSRGSPSEPSIVFPSDGQGKKRLLDMSPLFGCRR